MRKKIMIVMFALALLSLLGIFVFINKESTLEIRVVPNDSNISVDNKEVGKGQISLRLKNGTHQISATRNGYNTYSEKLSINKDFSQTIILTQKQNPQEQANIINVAPFTAESFQPISSDVLIAIDSKNSNLIKIEKNVVTTLYAKPVYSFSFTNPYVVLIEKGDRSKIAVVNANNGSVKNFDAKNISPVVSVSVTSDATGFYLLGNLDPATRNTNLYFNSLNVFDPQNKGVYKADNVKDVGNKKLLLTLSADAADLSSFSILDTSTNVYVYRSTGNGVIVSPYYKNIVIYSSKTLRTVSLENFTENYYEYSFTNQKITWYNADTLLVLTNNFPGISFYTINILANTKTSNTKLTKLDNVSVRFVIGVVENTLFIQDSDGKMWSVNLF